jgi:hypothetical protein
LQKGFLQHPNQKIKKLKIILAETHENLFTVAKIAEIEIAEIEITRIEIAEIETLPTCPYPYVTSELGA